MKIEILYFEGCPTYLEAEQTVREVVAEQDTEAGVALVAVNTDEEAERLRFPGSPTSGWTVGTCSPFPTETSGRWVAERTRPPRA